MPEAAAPPSAPLRAYAVGTIPVKVRADDMSLDQLLGIRKINTGPTLVSVVSMRGRGKTFAGHGRGRTIMRIGANRRNARWHDRKLAIEISHNLLAHGNSNGIRVFLDRNQNVDRQPYT